MRIKALSEKQARALTWWCGADAQKDAIICDGAVRSGKTLCLSLSFVLWSMACFRGERFALCGKTIQSLRRNLVAPLCAALRAEGFRCEDKISRAQLIVGRRGVTNTYYLFGGKDEGSAALIQGVTLAGVLFDEAALMPRSFVEQALARCSVACSKYWFNCNPDHPGHWFYREWIARAAEKNALYLHFTMADNPALTREVRARYERLYTGTFHERFVLGRWTAAYGAVYPMFSARRHVVKRVPPCTRHVISCDYGTVNPASFGLWGERDGVWYRIREYYHDSREKGFQCTDEEYAAALERLAGTCAVEAVVVDPSAAGFIECLRRRGAFKVVRADNDVRAGISAVSSALAAETLRFHESCADCIREFGLYRWSLSAAGDAPVKENDHAMDDVRYFVQYVHGAGRTECFAARLVSRK